MNDIPKDINEEKLNTNIDDSAIPAVPEQPKKLNKTKKRIGLILFILLNAGVLIYTASLEFSKPAPKYRGEPFGLKNILFLVGAIMCVALVLITETVKYMLMMRHLGEKVSVKCAFETAALGKYYDSITPSGAGGQPFQIWHLYSHGYSSGASSAMPLSGFVTMQFGFVFLALFVFIFNNNAISKTALKVTAYIGAFVYMIVPVMIIISALAPQIAAKIVVFFVKIGTALHLVKQPKKSIMKSVKALKNYSNSLKKITNNVRLVILLLALSLVFQTALCSIPYFVIHTFGGNLGFFRALSMCVFVYAAITIVPTPGNSGAAEGSFYLLFSQLETSGLFWAMLVWRFLCYYSFILIGLIIYGYNALIKLRNKKKET